MTALPATAQEPVKVGMSGPFSGGLSLLGQSVRDGVEVAFAEINDSRRCERTQARSSSPRTTAMSRCAPSRPRGSSSSRTRSWRCSPSTGTAPSAALLPFVTESKTPLLFPYAFAHALTTPINRDVFTTLPEVRVQMMVLANYILKELKQTKVAAIYQNDDFGQDAVAGLEERFGARM